MTFNFDLEAVGLQVAFDVDNFLVIFDFF